MSSAGGRTESLHGIGASAGIAVGRAYLLDRKGVKTPHYRVSEPELEPELMRFKTAVALSDHQLVEIKERLEKTTEGKEHAMIIEAHRLMLQDAMIVEAVKQTITRERTNAEWAIREVVLKLQAQFEALEDEYFRERKSDIDFIGDRLIRNLLGMVVDPESGPEIPPDAILVAHDLSPSDAALLLTQGRCAGFITDVGGYTSHTAIVARSREVPGVVGAETASERIAHGDLVAIDGGRGLVMLHPTTHQVALFEEATRRQRERGLALGELRDLPAVSIDGRTMALYGNIEFKDEVPHLLAQGAEGIGLYRTEFLYLGRETAPSEEEHFKAYRAVLEQMGPRPVTIRTVDLGGDKISALDRIRRGEKEQNPALGLRALRFCLKHRDVFRVQLRALLRASVFGRMKIMFPMVSGIQELREARAFLTAVRVELGREGHEVADNIPVGIMIETPSAALTADRLAKECDFFSVGTNDLIQYSMAIDRQNRDVAYLYRPLHLAMLRSFQQIVEAGHAANIPVGMCGEMAGDPLHTLVLSGLGFDNLSMSGSQLPSVKRIVRGHATGEGRRLVAQCLELDTPDEIERLVRSDMEARFGEGATGHRMDTPTP